MSGGHVCAADDVLGLEVAVDDAVPVEVLEHEDDLRDVEAGLPLGELVEAHEHFVEADAVDELHDEVDEVLFFVDAFERDDQGELEERQHVFLVDQQLDGRLVVDQLLRDGLQRQVLLALLVLHQVHRAVAPGAKVLHES